MTHSFPTPRSSDRVTEYSPGCSPGCSPGAGTTPPPGPARPGRSGLGGFALLGALGHHLVDQAEGLGFLRGHETVAFHCRFDRGDILAGMPGVDYVQPGAQVEDLPGVDLDEIGRAHV